MATEETLSPKARKAALFDHLRRAILTLELAPGADLDEAELCERFDLSRTPVREILRELDGLGYANWRDNRGARVSDLSTRTLHDFFLAAPMIYGAILRLAARNTNDIQLAELRAAQETFREAIHSGSAAARALANTRFHEITGAMAGNTYLLPSFHRLLIDHARIGMTFYQPTTQAMADNLSEACTQHDAIIAAIAARDEEAAADLSDAHWALSKHEIERYVLPAALNAPLGRLPLTPSA